MVDGKVDVDASDARIAVTADARRVGAVRTKRAPLGDASDGDSMREIRTHRARREKADADQAEIQVAQLRGQLVDAASVRRGIADCQFATMRMFETAPDRLAERIAAECGVAAHLVRKLLSDEIRLIRDEAARQVERLIEMYSERARRRRIPDDEKCY
ncbi:MAG: hypothetical protein WKH97_04120 [Casimicrobiaceae bacterium]